MSTSHRSSTRAFTLVEMLVVLGIIGVLVALLLPAVMAAMRNARNAAIAFEISQLDAAFESYKQAKGEYPPSFGDYNNSGTLVYQTTMGTPNRYTSVVERHFGRSYPKFIDNPNSTTDAKDNFYQNYAMNIDQAEALVYWLSGVSTDPTNPFDLNATRQGFYEFDKRRLVNADGDSFPSYQALYCRDTDYIYIENRNYIQFTKTNCTPHSGDPTTTTQKVLPYGTSATAPANPTRFQIICAGQDGEFGNLTTASMGQYPVKQFPAGVNYDAGDRDNITNFSNGKTLGDSRPE